MFTLSPRWSWNIAVIICGSMMLYLVIQLHHKSLASQYASVSSGLTIHDIEVRTSFLCDRGMLSNQEEKIYEGLLQNIKPNCKMPNIDSFKQMVNTGKGICQNVKEHFEKCSEGH